MTIPTVKFYVESAVELNLYAWDENEEKLLGEWPGVALTKESDNKYYAEIPCTYVGKTINYILNITGGLQTKNLKVETFEAGYTYVNADPDPTNTTIYLDNNWFLEDLKIHSWDPTLWSGQTWDNRKSPDGTITTDWGTFSYWHIEATQIANDKTGSLLVTATGKQTADLTGVNYDKDVYLNFVYKNSKDSLQILTTPY